MYLYPAIDLYQGQAVRLTHGNYQDMTVYSSEPLSVARLFTECGAEKIHIVDLEGAKADFAFINQIPGRKIILKGNHDYWWSTAAKFYRFCEENGFSDMEILNNNHFEYEGIAICGTRGWFFEEERSGEHDEKVFKRELLRLEASLKSAGEKPKIVFLHYPPRYKGYECPEILKLLEQYGVGRCFYGHLHGASHGLAMEGLWDGVDFRLVAADKLNFRPYQVLP